MSTGTLEGRYLDWLYDRVVPFKSRTRNRTYRMLFQQLHDTIFVAIVPHDENRIADAQDLRYEYLAHNEAEQGDPDWTRSPCSMLELLIILSRMVAFELDEDLKPWFWHFLEILELEQFDDNYYNSQAKEVIQATLERVIWRTYAPNGEGGLFPLRRPGSDQRKVELWYQLNAYLLEQF